MAVDIRWLEEANDDIQSILAYISSDNPKAASAYIEAIAQSCEKLSQFPESGRAFNERYRILVIRNHLVLYRYDAGAGEVTIARVIDGRRDIATILGGGEA
jgi:plasmid stabilization system protein ParE